MIELTLSQLDELEIADSEVELVFFKLDRDGLLRLRWTDEPPTLHVVTVVTVLDGLMVVGDARGDLELVRGGGGGGTRLLMSSTERSGTGGLGSGG